MSKMNFLPKETFTYENFSKVTCVITDYMKTRSQMVLGGLGLLAGTVITVKYGPDLRHRCFSWLNCSGMQLIYEEYEEFKKELFVSLAKLKSHDSELQKENAISILEIGVGIGTNFSYYPDGCRLVVVDPNRHFAKYYNKNRAKFPNIKSESIIVCKGEDMDMVESNSVDVVVTTWVLCSVNDIAKVVSQVKRVLVPGGKYFFIEHIHEWDRKVHRIRYCLQNILTWSGISPFLLHGCHLNRNPLPALNDVGFSDVSAEKVYAPVPGAFMSIIIPHLRGTATK